MTIVSPKAILTRAELVALVEAALKYFSRRECPACQHDLTESMYGHAQTVEEFILDFVARLNEAPTP